MSIAVQVHAKDPAALAELIARAMHDNVVIDREAEVAHLSLLVDAEEKALQRRREAWHWLNSLPTATLDRDNDWSDV
jgi:hypothetical protein